GPFRDVAVHVEQSPRIRLLRAADVWLLTSVVPEPRVVAHGRWIVAERVGRRRAGPRGVFPFGLGRQAVLLSGARREPLAVVRRGGLSGADQRLRFLPPSPRLVRVGRRRTRDRVARVLGAGQSQLALALQIE